MAPSLTPLISVSRRGSARGDADYTVVWVRGEHDIATKASLVVALDRAARLDDAPLLVDLSAVTFMDASTIGALVASRTCLQSGGQTLEVRAPSPRALRVLEQCGLAHLVHREPRHSTGVAAALGTWVDVSPIAPSGPAGPVTRAPVRPRSRQPTGALAAALVLTEEAVTIADVDRAGP